MKVLIIVALVAFVAVSVSGRSRQRGRARGRSADPDIVASANDNIAAIDEALALIEEKKDQIFGEVQDLPPAEAQQASVDLQEHIADAIEIAQENPQAQELQPEIIQEKLEDTKADIEGYLQEAKRNQLALDSYGTDMSPEEAAIHHQELQKNLELALHATEQHGAAIQEEKAIDAGAAPEEVAQIAPEIVAAGRAMRGRSAGSSSKKGRSSKRGRGKGRASSRSKRGRSSKRGRGRASG